MEEKPKEEKSEIKKEQESPEYEEPKKRFVSINELTKKESKINTIFSKFKKKLEETKPGLFLRPNNVEYKSLEFKPLFQYESTFPLKVKQEFSFIYDCLNFICYQPKDEEDSKNNEKYIEKLQNVFSYLKEKGTILILIDEFYIENFFPNFLSFLGSEYKTKLFINFYFMDFRPFLFLVSIQKMGESATPIISKDIKILITDYFSKSKLLGSSTLSTMNEYLKDPLNRMRLYRLQCEKNYHRIKTLHPGQFYEMRIKASPLDQVSSYTATIYDSPVPEHQTNKKCCAVEVSYEITQEIIFFKQFSFSKMCNQLKASRLIVLEFAILNPSHLKDMAIELYEEIQLMKPEGFTDSIQVSLWENHAHKETVFQDEKF